jgi:hypothetical protein
MPEVTTSPNDCSKTSGRDAVAMMVQNFERGPISAHPIDAWDFDANQAKPAISVSYCGENPIGFGMCSAA